MTRAFALLFAAVTLLAGAGHARAQGFFDMRDIMGGGRNFGRGGSSPIPRQTVNFSGQYAPGTIYINTAERRLYLVLANGQALRYGIGVGRDGFRWGGTHRIIGEEGMAELDAALADAGAAARPAAPHGRRHRQSAGRARHVSGLDALPHPRLERAGDDRPGGILRLLPHDQ